MTSQGITGLPRLVVVSVQGNKSLPAERLADLERLATVDYLAREDAMSPDEAIAAFADADVVAVTPKVSPPLTGDLVARLPRLRGIVLHATGYDFVDVAALQRQGVVVSTLPSYSTRSVAEQTIGMLLALSSRLHLGNDRSRGLVAPTTSLRGFELAGRTLGIIGCGRIGSTVAALAQGLGMTTIAHDIAPKPVTGVTYVERDELLDRSHVVSLHTPLAWGAPPMLGAAEFARMPEGSVLVNSSRSALVDDDAMIDAIRRGHLRGYAVDDETLGGPRVDDLLREGRILQTGHSAWWTDEVLERGATMWADAIVAMLTGEPTNVAVPLSVDGPLVAAEPDVLRAASA
ncbi:2-hydroxyacid dehydrogenase [Egicoccus halophilus]|uniref:Dehydrogenase n=1 Tax=Egicoccus halophilus TaxID=1670830 RepID=A0A8J3AA48_9ACTN|nr:2-hydroxyacid dehydrogenase [Egicoccus halophilus]GGI06059.1 dehydrogenase [Egicoccus halophilus]